MTMKLEINKNGTLDASQNVPVVDSDLNFSDKSSDDESIDMSIEKPSCSKTKKGSLFIHGEKWNHLSSIEITKVKDFHTLNEKT